MTKESESKEVANWEQRLAQEAKEVARTERPSVSRISFKSGVMSYMDKAMPNNSMECIVVANTKERFYYDTEYDPDNMHPPRCFAQGTVNADLVPHPSVPEPIASSCDICPLNEFGSAEKGKGKACKERRALAVIPALDDPEAVEKAEIATMSIPTMSMKNWSSYANELSARAARPPWSVITRVVLRPDAKSQFKVDFEHVGNLDSSMLGAVDSKIEFATNILLTPPDLNKSEDEPEAPRAKGKKTKY